MISPTRSGCLTAQSRKLVAQLSPKSGRPRQAATDLRLRCRQSDLYCVTWSNWSTRPPLKKRCCTILRPSRYMATTKKLQEARTAQPESRVNLVFQGRPCSDWWSSVHPPPGIADVSVPVYVQSVSPVLLSDSIHPHQPARPIYYTTREP